MKKILITVIVILMLALSACQPTPEEPVVIQKDNFENLVNNTAVPLETEEGQLTSEAQQSEEAGSIPEGKRRITWENTVTNEYPGGDVDIVVNVDALIDEEQPKASVYLVEADEYDEEFARKVVNDFLGDTYYDGIYTKDDFLLSIMPMRQAIANMTSNFQGIKDNAQSFLHVKERMYERAPVSNAEGHIAFDRESYQPVLDLYRDYVCVKGYPQNGRVAEIYLENAGRDQTNFYYYSEDGTREYDPLIYNEYDGTPANGMTVPFEDAKQIAEKAVREIYGEDMAHVQTDLCRATVFDDTWMRITDSQKEECYVFTFTPVYGGIAQLYAPEARNDNLMTMEGVYMYEQAWDYEYSLKWPANFVQVYVDDSGLAEFFEYSPAKIIEQVNDNVAMLPFDDIFESFKKNIFYSSVWTSGSLRRLKINIERIEFGMIRVPMKDDPDVFYMVPAWQFIGSRKEIAISGNTPRNESGKTFLVLNAIDGSVINTAFYINRRPELLKTIGMDKNF